jgi:hypothetical protein
MFFNLVTVPKLHWFFLKLFSVSGDLQPGDAETCRNNLISDGSLQFPMVSLFFFINTDSNPQFPSLRGLTMRLLPPLLSVSLLVTFLVVSLSLRFSFVLIVFDIAMIDLLYLITCQCVE